MSTTSWTNRRKSMTSYWTHHERYEFHISKSQCTAARCRHNQNKTCSQNLQSAEGSRWYCNNTSTGANSAFKHLRWTGISYNYRNHLEYQPAIDFRHNLVRCGSDSTGMVYRLQYSFYHCYFFGNGNRQLHQRPNRIQSSRRISSSDSTNNSHPSSRPHPGSHPQYENYAYDHRCYLAGTTSNHLWPTHH